MRRHPAEIALLLATCVAFPTGMSQAHAGRPPLLPHDVILYSSDQHDPNSTPPVGSPLSPGKNIDIYSLSIRGSQRLTREVGNDQFAVWSPDGTKIAFEGSRAVGPSGVDYDIFVMDSDGSDVARLTDTPGFDVVPAWSPDGTRISFTSFRSGDPELYVMSLDGSDIRRITHSPGWDFAFGNWCPDGRIVVNSNRGDPELPVEPLPLRTFDVYVMDPDGTDVVPLTEHPANDDEAVCSPDGSEVAFVSERDGSREIYVMDIHGKNQQRLTFGGGSEHRPAWSPDARRIAFDTDINGNLEIYVMSSDGTDVSRLTNSSAYDFHPVFRPPATRSGTPEGSRDS